MWPVATQSIVCEWHLLGLPDNTTLSPTPVLQPKNEPGISLVDFCSCPKARELINSALKILDLLA